MNQCLPLRYLSIFEQTIALHNIITYTPIYIELLPVMFYLFLAKRINDKSLQVIIVLAILGFFIDLFSVYLTLNNKNLYILPNIFTLIETLFLSFFFSRILYSKTAKKIFIVPVITFVFLWAFFFVRSGSKEALDNCINMELILILVFSVYYFYEQLKKPETLFIYTQPRFWVVLCYLIYSSGVFFLFLYLNTLNFRDQMRYYNINSIFLIFKSICLSVAMFMRNNVSKDQKFQLH